MKTFIMSALTILAGLLYIMTIVSLIYVQFWPSQEEYNRLIGYAVTWMVFKDVIDVRWVNDEKQTD
jgi:uncharacterized membrane protein YqjE